MAGPSNLETASGSAGNSWSRADYRVVELTTSDFRQMGLGEPHRRNRGTLRP